MYKNILSTYCSGNSSRFIAYTALTVGFARFYTNSPIVTNNDLSDAFHMYEELCRDVHLYQQCCLNLIKYTKQ